MADTQMPPELEQACREIMDDAILHAVEDEDFPIGEWPGDLSDSIAKHLPEHHGVIDRIKHTTHDLFSKLVSRDGEEHLVNTANIEMVEKDEESGTFLVHLKNELKGNEVKVIAVTGAALFACAALIRQRRRN